MSKVVTGIDKSGSFRVYVTITTDMVEEARKIHNTTPLATAGLGRTLTGAGIMGILLKSEDEKLTVQFKGDGPAQQILACANGRGDVKGYIVNPDVDLPLTPAGKLDVGGSLGIGTLTVIKDLGLKEPYMGQIDLVSGEIADDLTAYYYISEQQNTSIALGVKIDTDYTVKAAGGMFIQMLPNAEEGAIVALEDMIGKMPALTSIIDEVQSRGMGKTDLGICEDLLNEIFKDMPEDYAVSKLSDREIGWVCDCSQDRIERALMTIGVSEMRKIIEEDGEAELTCSFCTKKYHFDKAQLEELLEAMI